MPYAPRVVIAGPPRRPFPFGLFSVVSLAEAATERWENGVTWEALTCDPVAVLVGDCDAPEGFPKQFPDAGPGTGEAAAFTVYGTYKCSPIGHSDPFGHAQAQAREVLRAREEQATEARLWSVLHDAPTVLTGGDPLEALGALEAWIAANYGSLGVVHASRNAATTLASRGLIAAKGNQMQTVLGTPVVVGSGYPGTGVGRDEVQTITKTDTPTAGNITLTYDGQTTGNIPWNATSAQVKTALDNLSNITTVTTAGGPLNTTPITVTFDTVPGKGENVPQMTVNGTFTGGGAEVTTTTQGDSGTPPSAGSEYLAVSPSLFGYRSEMFEQTNRAGDLLDRSTNDLYGIAERNYLLGMEPCGVAFAPMTLGDPA